MRDRAKIVTAAFMVAFATIALSGCSYTTQRAPGMGLQGIALEGLCRQDYVVLDTVSGKGSVTTIFGFKTGDNQFGFVGNEGLPAGGGSLIPGVDVFASLFRGLREAIFGPDRNAGPAAVYDALSKVPEADSFLPATRTVSTTGLPGFLGAIYSVEEATVRGKAVKINNGDGKNCPASVKIVN